MKRFASALAQDAARVRPQPRAVPKRAFASASRRRAAEKQSDGGKAKDPDRELQPGKSPFATFVEVIREEIEKNKQSDNVRQLSGKVGAVADSKTWAAMRQTYERARVSLRSAGWPSLRAFGS
jgi:import inner membrane translocase subunit TIM44